jgi:hypothetical protein
MRPQKRRSTFSANLRQNSSGIDIQLKLFYLSYRLNVINLFPLMAQEFSWMVKRLTINIWAAPILGRLRNDHANEVLS